MRLDVVAHHTEDSRNNPRIQSVGPSPCYARPSSEESARDRDPVRELHRRYGGARPVDERLSFGSVLKRMRLAAGLTHEALAERASLGARTISDLERGVSRVPRADTLALLVKALNLSPPQRALLEAAARRYPSVLPDATSSVRGLSYLPFPLTSFVGR